MIKKLFIILLLSIPLFAQTSWYVRPNTGEYGLEDGSDWDNAFDGFADIAWGSISAGDIIYISGGTDSAMYYETMTITNVHGTAANWITIRNSYDTGHNGRVIIDGEYARAYGINFGASGATVSYLYFKGIEVRRTGTGGTQWTVGGKWQNNCVTLDSLYIYDNRSYGIFWHGQDTSPYTNDAYACDSLLVKNCYLSNKEEDPNNNQTDLVESTASTNTVLHDNVFHLRRPVYANADHCDGLQTIRTEGWLIYNNFFIDDSGAYSQANIHSFWDDIADGKDSVIYYNNVFYDGGTWASPAGTGNGTTFFMRREPPGIIDGTNIPSTLIVIHNTIVSYGPNYIPVDMQPDRGSDYFKNNIIAQFGSGNNGEQAKDYSGFFSCPGDGDTTFFDEFEGNYYYREWGTEYFSVKSGGYMSGGGNTTTSTITGVENLNSTYAADDTSGHPYFQTDFTYGDYPGGLRQSTISSYTMDDFRNGDRPMFWLLSDSSGAINFGKDIQGIVEGMGLEWKDILGNPRDSSPDAGAFQYSVASADTIPSFSFTPVTNAELNTEYIATSPITGIDSVTHFWTTTSAEFKINYNSTYSTVMKTADPDDGADTVYVKNMTGGTYEQLYTETIVGGGNAQNFNVTTKADPATTGVIGRSSDGKIMRASDGKIIKVRE